MGAKIERLAAKTVFDPPAYTQTIKVTGAETILFISHIIPRRLAAIGDAA